MVSKEIDRKYRVIDMMLTMHSVLRDRNNRRALIVDVINWVVSLILVATVFAGDKILAVAGITPHMTKYVIGISSLSVFFLSILTLRIDWKQQATRHQEALLKLSSLKAKYRDGVEYDDITGAQTATELSRETDFAMSTLPPIPERKFNSLKAIHLRKVEVSKALSRTPGASASLLRLRILFDASFKKLRHEQT